MNYSTEAGYDHVIVEARTAGGEDWTTLPDKNGGTTTTVPAECAAGFFVAMHPFLAHYLTVGNPCTASGTSGAWNSFTGESDGWRQVAFDLSAYAGKRVEVSIAYVSDPFTGGTGLFIDDTRVTTTGGQLDAEGFETGLGPWTIAGAPAGSPGNDSEFVRSQAVIDWSSATVTRDSVLLRLRLRAGRHPGRAQRAHGPGAPASCCADRARPRPPAGGRGHRARTGTAGWVRRRVAAIVYCDPGQRTTRFELSL